MQNITLDTTNFSEQLGLYDFFNVLIYGATFISGICLLSKSIYQFLWNNLSFQKGLGIALLIYITGMLLQEFGSIVDKYRTKLYKGMHGSILKGTLDNDFETKNSNAIIENPVLLKKYRCTAEKLLKKHKLKVDENWFENEYINSYIFSISQYYVSIKGKDKKAEKLRALFSMSKTLMSCFFLLAVCAIAALIFNVDMSVEICRKLGLTIYGYGQHADKIIMIAMFVGIGTAFLYRSKRTMRNFLLILLGTYNAIMDDEERTRGAHADE